MGIRHPEELSLKRDIPPEILRKGAHVESEAQIQPYMKPGEVSKNGNYNWMLINFRISKWNDSCS